jgi:hypothetical protein
MMEFVRSQTLIPSEKKRILPKESETQAVIPEVPIGEFGSKRGVPEEKSTTIPCPKYHLFHYPCAITVKGLNVTAIIIKTVKNLKNSGTRNFTFCFRCIFQLNRE